MPTRYEKWQSIIDNYVNGNWSDAQAQVKKLAKFEMLLLLQQWLEQDADAIEIVKSLVA